MGLPPELLQGHEPLPMASYQMFLAMAVALALLLMLEKVWWSPNRKARRLRSQGLLVLPYAPLVGNALTIHGMLAKKRQQAVKCTSPSDYLDLISHTMPFYGEMSRVHGKRYVYWWGSSPALTVVTPEDAKEVLSTKFKQYEKNKILTSYFEKVFGKGLLSVSGQDWERHRRILGPAFYTDKLKAMAADMSFCALELCTRWETLVREKGGYAAEIEVSADFTVTTADIIGRTCFGSSYEVGKKVFQNQHLLGIYAFNDLLLNFVIPGYKYIPTPLNVRCWKLQREVEADLRAIVESRRDAIKQEGIMDDKSDLLSMIIAESDRSAAEEHDEQQKLSGGLTTQEVMDQCKTFFFAGHETTASLLTWVMMLLALYPDWQERCRSEVLEVFGDNKSQEKGAAAADHVNQLRIMHMVLLETLRLYHPVSDLMPRESVSPSQVMNGLCVEKGMIFSIMSAVIHRDKEIWGEDADEFRPERFTEGVSKACKHPYGFLPFAAGPRNCIGHAFAMMEAKLILAPILQRFTFTLSPSYIHSPQAGITLKPLHGMPLLLSFL